MKESVLEIGFWSASQFVQVQVHAHLNKQMKQQHLALKLFVNFTI